MKDAGMDLSRAKVIYAENAAGAEAKAVEVLVEEIFKRTGILLQRAHQASADDSALIIVGLAEGLLRDDQGEGSLTNGSEGYRVIASHADGCARVTIAGADARGILYGVGYFLRNMRWYPGELGFDRSANVERIPTYPIRGHQLGYRPKTNAYDAWSVEQYDQYIRELALFGANSIEIMPPRTDDDATGPLMQVDPLQMMIELSSIIDAYGLDVWVWYPNMFEDIGDEQVKRAELEEREEIFSKLPRIDAVFIPGSDPGGMPPDQLFEWAGEMATTLQRFHPASKIWISPQVMNYDSKPWLEGYYEQVNRKPAWFGGAVFGPHVDDSLPDMRSKIPAEFPIRRYEDITHMFICQYPVTDWDLPFALTLGRECYNPRPVAMKHIHNLLDSYAVGNIGYSEGINDDVNKFLWLDQDWDPTTPVVQTLRDYARMFIGYDEAGSLARGFMALEENWSGPLLANEGIDITLLQWMELESRASTDMLNNYRFQMGLMRAYYDAYIKRRFIYETELEYRAKDELRLARMKGSLPVLAEVKAILLRAREQPVARDYKARCEQLADALFENIGSQLTVGKHKAISEDRGAFMDAIDAPLNDIQWLLLQCERIQQLEMEDERQAAIFHVLNRTNPGAGGYYDNLGSYRTASRLDPGLGPEQDPGYLQSPRSAPAVHLLALDKQEKEAMNGVPLSWVRHVTISGETPIILTYDHLDPHADYVIEARFVGDYAKNRYSLVQLTANDQIVLKENIRIQGGTCTNETIAIPVNVYAEGKLKLAFTHSGGFKRVNLAEVFIKRYSPSHAGRECSDEQ